MFKKNGILFYRQWGDISLGKMIDFYYKNKDIHTIFFNGMNEYEVGWFTTEENNKIKEFEKIVKARRTKIICVFATNDGIHNYYNKTLTVFENNTIIHHFPTAFLSYTYFSLRGLYGEKIDVGYNKYKKMDKLFISLNNKAHIHRSQMIDKIFELGLDEYAYLSWLEPEVEYNYQFWKPEKLLLDADYETNKDSYTNIPNEMFTSFISLVAESTMNVPFITEKTMIPIVFEKPFLIWGCPEINKEVENMGFARFDEIFDYSFDEEIDDEKRLTGLLENLVRLKNENLKHLRDKIKHKLLYNKNLIIKISENYEMIPDVVVEYAKLANEKEEFIYMNLAHEELNKIPKYNDYLTTIRDKPFFLR